MMVSSTGGTSSQLMMMPVLLSMPMSVRRAARLVQPDVLRPGGRSQGVEPVYVYLDSSPGAVIDREEVVLVAWEIRVKGSRVLDCSCLDVVCVQISHGPARVGPHGPSGVDGAGKSCSRVVGFAIRYLHNQERAGHIGRV